MDNGIINNLSFNMIFEELETEAQNKYCNIISIKNNKFGSFVNFLREDVELITSFSTHSLTKSITLYHCFDYLKNFSLPYNQSSTNKKIDLKYIRYIKYYMNLIDLDKFKGFEGEIRFESLLVNLTLIKLNEEKNTINEYVDFIFDFLFLIWSSKEKYDITKSFIKALFKVSKISSDSFISEDSKKYFFELNLTLFQNIFDSLYTSTLVRKNKIWEFVFDSEKWVPDNDSDIISILYYSDKFNDINRTITNVDKANKYLEIHNNYLKACFKKLSKITAKNKEDYLVNFKKNYDVIGYVFVLHYLNDVKKYLRDVSK